MATFNEALFWRKVTRTDTCWIWDGYINRDGYGEYASEALTTRLAHRIAKALDEGGVIDPRPLDHLCRNRRCVRPEHLEYVSVKVNTARSDAALAQASKTHCPQGHPYDETNTINRADGRRVCRACKNARAREARARAKD